jgi:hypothetical protein
VTFRATPLAASETWITRQRDKPAGRDGQSGSALALQMATVRDADFGMARPAEPEFGPAMVNDLGRFLPGRRTPGENRLGAS